MVQTGQAALKRTKQPVVGGRIDPDQSTTNQAEHDDNVSASSHYRTTVETVRPAC
ncbi:MAG: hypothetical protein HRT36_03195 [Alphaproteobacteria bacterium]|nr:hypothetical protein [Alphaproteobacteria bacterium]